MLSFSQLRPAPCLLIGLWLPLISLALAMDFSFRRALTHAESGGIEQPVAHQHPGARQRTDIPPRGALAKVDGAPALAPRGFFLRVDLRQNLTIWPVLSNHIERSPPAVVAS